MIIIEVLCIRHDWPEKAGFTILRPHGLEYYTFLHFMTTVDIEVRGKRYTAPPGACIFYAPDTPQWFLGKHGILHNWVHIDASLGAVLEQFNIPEDEIIYPYSTSFISEIFRKAEAEYYSDDAFREEMLDVYMTEFLIRFSRAMYQAETECSLGTNAREKLRELRQKILLTPEKKWSVQEMARLVSLSPSRFHAVYRAYFGTSPMKDVIEARIHYAKSQLLSDRESLINEIAEQLGYSDQYHFIRQFKSITGETPAAYRKRR